MEIIPSHYVSSKLKEIRKEKKLSQQKFGALFGISRTKIAHIEKAYVNVSINDLGMMLKVLGVTWAKFFEGLNDV